MLLLFVAVFWAPDLLLHPGYVYMALGEGLCESICLYAYILIDLWGHVCRTK